MTAPRTNRSVDTTGTSTGTDTNSTLRVLLVEDDRDNAHLIEEMLTAEASAEDALVRFDLETRGRLSEGLKRLSQGGVEALRELARAIRAGEDVAMVPDGPRGPARRLQAGIVALAATTGAPIVPVGVAARPARRLHSWDRFMVPVPFARCAVVFGGALEVKRHDEREDARARVEQALEDATDAADALVGARR